MTHYRSAHLRVVLDDFLYTFSNFNTFAGKRIGTGSLGGKGRQPFVGAPTSNVLL